MLVPEKKDEDRTEAKIVTDVWGTEWIQFLATLTIFQRDDLKKGINSSYSIGAIHSILHRVLEQNS